MLQLITLEVLFSAISVLIFGIAKASDIP